MLSYRLFKHVQVSKGKRSLSSLLISQSTERKHSFDVGAHVLKTWPDRIRKPILGTHNKNSFRFLLSFARKSKSARDGCRNCLRQEAFALSWITFENC